MGDAVTVAQAPAALATTDEAEKARIQRRTIQTLLASQVCGGIGQVSGISVTVLLAKDLSGDTTIAGLTALGGADHELEIHIRSALNVGCTRTEIVEVIMQMAVYAGFPRALSALAAARAAFKNAEDG